MFAFLPAKGEGNGDYDVYFHLLMVLTIFGFFFALAAQKQLLPALNVRTVWAMTLVLWFVLVLSRDLHTTSNRVVALVLSAPSMWSLYMCCSKHPVGRAGRVADYLWFLAVVVLLGFWGFRFSPLALFGRENTVPWITPLDGVLGGMTFMVLVTYGTFLFNFIPLPDKDQSFKSRLKEWRGFVTLMARDLRDVHTSRVELFWLSAVLIGVFLTHYWVQWMTSGIVISLAISLISVWSWFGGASDRQRAR